MVFSSLIFLFAFLPAVLVLYFGLPMRFRNMVLFLVSLFFYAWGEPIYLILMLVSITSAYGFGFLIARHRETDKRRARMAMVASLTVNLGLLFFFKYYGFFAENLSRLPFLSIPAIANLALPIGISFYTFQIISYTVDLYRGDCKLQRSYLLFGTYVTLFPQLIAGPIVRYREVDEQLSERHHTISGFASGVRRFSCGLAKKVLVGDAFASAFVYFETLATQGQTMIGAWISAICYALHLYYDFSGYSDMAIGLGRMLGFEFPENFNYPYISRSITEFWRRWHISLSSWFREYVYIPLGGNRRGRGRTYANLAVVWLLTGLWHGANWNFLLWGVYFCVILILEKAFLLSFLERIPSFWRHVYAVLLIVIGFLIFSHVDLSLAKSNFLALWGVGTVGIGSPITAYRLPRLLPLLLIGTVGATPIPRRLFERFSAKGRGFAEPILTTAALALSVAYLVDSTFSPFAYTQF